MLKLTAPCVEGAGPSGSSGSSGNSEGDTHVEEETETPTLLLLLLLLYILLLLLLLLLQVRRSCATSTALVSHKYGARGLLSDGANTATHPYKSVRKADREIKKNPFRTVDRGMKKNPPSRHPMPRCYIAPD